MSEEQTQNLSSEPVTLEKLAAQLAQLMAEFRDFRAFAEPKIYDTKPIWERALAEIVESRREMNERFERLETETRRLRHAIGELSVENIELRSRVRDLEEQREPRH